MTNEPTRERLERALGVLKLHHKMLVNEIDGMTHDINESIDAFAVGIALASAELERQSVTDEEVAEAIRQFKSGKFGNNFWPGERNINLAIKALQDYRPEREVCEMCGIEELPKDAGPHDFYVLDGCLWHCDSVFGWEGSKIRLCPNCGRKLEESE